MTVDLSRTLSGVISIFPREGSLGEAVIPVNPPEERAERSSDYSEVGLLSGYSIGHRGPSGLLTVSFSSFFPNDLNEPWVNPDLPFRPSRASGWADYFDKILKAKIVCLVAIGHFGIYHEMVLRDFDWRLEAANGDPRDIQYSMTWVEYVRVGLAGAATFAARVRYPQPGTGPGTRYTIVSGDTLWGIAKRFYGDGSLWRIIWDANKPMTSGNPDLIYVGEVVYIPPR